MSPELPTRTNWQIRAAVETELEWASNVDAAAIAVAVDDGVVRLSGVVRSLVELRAANRATLNVRDVKTVVNDLSVQP